VDLPELDLFHIVQISGGAQHQKQCLAVMLQLRTLVAGWCILDGQMAATLYRHIRSANSGKDSVPEKPGRRGPTRAASDRRRDHDAWMQMCRKRLRQARR
jgi:hypothetical protein